jgi:hypothetical protein
VARRSPEPVVRQHKIKLTVWWDMRHDKLSSSSRTMLAIHAGLQLWKKPFQCSDVLAKAKDVVGDIPDTSAGVPRTLSVDRVVIKFCNNSPHTGTSMLRTQEAFQVCIAQAPEPEQRQEPQSETCYHSPLFSRGHKEHAQTAV